MTPGAPTTRTTLSLPRTRPAVTDLILNAYLSAGRDVPGQVTKKLRHMAHSDPDDAVRHAARRYLREPWARSPGDQR